MNRQIIIQIGLLAGAVLTISVLLATQGVAAQDNSRTDGEVIARIVSRLPVGGPEKEEGVIAQTVPALGEGDLQAEKDILRVIVTLDKAFELPEGPADAWGVLLNQSGNALLIGKFSTRLVDGERACAPPEGGKMLKIFLKESTHYVEDATDFNQAKVKDESNDLHVQQVLRSVPKLDKLPQCASLLVWGEQQGDGIIADVILFHDELR